MVFFTSWSFPIPVTTWSVFSDVEARYGEWVEGGWDVLAILGRICCHQTSTYAVYDSWITMIKARLALPLRLRVDDLDRLLRLIAECINDCSLSRSFWTACFCGWRVILRISWRMLKFSERFTASSGMSETLKSTFASSVARLNLSKLSRFLRWQSSCTVCSFSSPSGLPELSWFRICSSSVTGFPVLSEELGSSCNTPTISWATGFPERSSLVLGDWVGLEEPNWTVSPSDCWTSFPTGRRSTVQPKSSFPLIQLRSCLKEIFGGGRGDKYCLLYNGYPPFNLSALTMQLGGSTSWRMIAFDLVW